MAASALHNHVCSDRDVCGKPSTYSLARLERIGTYSGTYRNGNKMATLGQEWESKRNWTSPAEAVGPYPISQILWRSCTECVRTYTERVRTYGNS